MEYIKETITGRGREMLDILKASNEWISRNEIARATKKRVLSPHDKILLERMTEAGIIEKRQVQSNTPIGFSFQYKFKQESGE